MGPLAPFLASAALKKHDAVQPSASDREAARIKKMQPPPRPTHRPRRPPSGSSDIFRRARRARIAAGRVPHVHPVSLTKTEDMPDNDARVRQVAEKRPIPTGSSDDRGSRAMIRGACTSLSDLLKAKLVDVERRTLPSGRIPSMSDLMDFAISSEDLHSESTISLRLQRKKDGAAASNTPTSPMTYNKKMTMIGAEMGRNSRSRRRKRRYMHNRPRNPTPDVGADEKMRAKHKFGSIHHDENGGTVGEDFMEPAESLVTSRASSKVSVQAMLEMRLRDLGVAKGKLKMVTREM